MYCKKAWLSPVAALVIISGLVCTAAPVFAASKEKVLHRFNGKDGASPQAGLIFDAAGNLYGTTYGGGSTTCGSSGCGTVFKLSIDANGKWSEKVLHAFGFSHGDLPTSVLAFDRQGNLYGTTTNGGPYANGTVFQLTPGKDGTWKEIVLHSFYHKYGLPPRQGGPMAGVILDATGNLYGTSPAGGSDDNGAVFRLAPDGYGKWKMTTLHSFNCKKDGCDPSVGLMFDTSGNLYGSSIGGAHDAGIVFQLTPQTDGTWKETVLHAFDSRDGFDPAGQVVFDAAGNLFGVTSDDGSKSCDCGTVFQLSPDANGKWKEKVLYSFNGADGDQPEGALVFDANGNLYGTTYLGGIYASGTVFKLTLAADGKWTHKVLYNFGVSGDGAYPLAGLVLDSSGNLYGTTSSGGDSTNCQGGCGVVFEVTP